MTAEERLSAEVHILQGMAYRYGKLIEKSAKRGAAPGAGTSKSGIMKKNHKSDSTYIVRVGRGKVK